MKKSKLSLQYKFQFNNRKKIRDKRTVLKHMLGFATSACEII